MKNSLKKQVRERSDGNCFYCGESLADKFEIDHFIARARGGSDDESNLVCACRKCNSVKSDYSIEMFRVWLTYFKSGRKSVSRMTPGQVIHLLGMDIADHSASSLPDIQLISFYGENENQCLSTYQWFERNRIKLTNARLIAQRVRSK